jgi:hypothetical protein
MTKEAALHAFYSSFGLKAYEENAVPTGDDAPDFPYLTYSVSSDSIGTDVALTASLWYRGTSWVQANAKEEEISRRIGRGGKILSCEGGAIWLRRGTPFAQSMGDESDDQIKRKYINITAEFLTAD